MDLFNDIFTDRRDLENFLGDNDCKDSDNISLRQVLIGRAQSLSLKRFLIGEHHFENHSKHKSVFEILQDYKNAIMGTIQPIKWTGNIF